MPIQLNNMMHHGKRKRIRAISAALAALCCAALCACGEEIKPPEQITAPQTMPTTTTAETTVTTTAAAIYPAVPVPDADSLQIADEELVKCRNFVLAEVQEGGDRVIAERGSQIRTFPASITKVMSMLTFYEICPPEKLGGTVTMTDDIRMIAISQQAMCAGFVDGEPCRIVDLMYGMMLPSGADAALALAIYASGSEEAFVQQMNLLAQRMGLKDTHFVNCTGLHDENHYSTAADIEAMMAYAIADPRCAEVLSTPRYQTAGNEKHANGIILKSSTLSRISGTELPEIGVPVTVLGGKTGFTDEAGQCLVTWARDSDGRQYICVVLGCDKHNAYDAVCDSLTLYQLAALPYGTFERYLYAWMTTTETTTTTTLPDAVFTSSTVFGKTLPTAPAWTSIPTQIADFSLTTTTTTTTAGIPAAGGQ